MSDNESKMFAAIIANRTPDCLRCLSYLLQAGIRNGHCSANDIPADMAVSHKNAIGASFKTLRGLGFVTDGVLKSTHPDRNSGIIMKWVLVNRSMAERFLTQQSKALGIAVEEGHREELFEFTNIGGKQVIRS